MMFFDVIKLHCNLGNLTITLRAQQTLRGSI